MHATSPVPTTPTGPVPTGRHVIESPQSAAYTEAIKKLCTDVVDLSKQEQITRADVSTGLKALHRFTVKMARVHEVELDKDQRPAKRQRFGDWLPRLREPSIESEQNTNEIIDNPEHGGEDTESEGAFDDPVASSTGPEARRVAERTPEELVEARLERLVLPMTVEVGTDALTAMRHGFYTGIQHLPMVIWKDNKRVETTFSADEVVEITNFFFSDMMGPKSLRRLSDLVYYYSAGRDDLVDPGMAARARILAEDSTTPDMFRPFFGALSRAKQHDTDENRVFKHIKEVLESLDFFKEYNHLKTMAQLKNADLIQVLKQRGQTTRKGVTLVSCLFNVLSESLNITKVGLNNVVHSIHGIEKLVAIFGEGLIVLLPPGSAHRLSRWGNQRMGYVYPILKQNLRGLDKLCEYIQVHVLDQIRQGKPIPLAQIKTGTKISLQERIQEAMEDRDDHGQRAENDDQRHE